MKKITSKEPISFRVNGSLVLNITPQGCLANDADAAFVKSRIPGAVSIEDVDIEEAVNQVLEEEKPEETQPETPAETPAAPEEVPAETQPEPPAEEQKPEETQPEVPLEGETVAMPSTESQVEKTSKSKSKSKSKTK